MESTLSFSSSRSDRPLLAKVWLSLTLSLPFFMIWYSGQTALFLFRLRPTCQLLSLWATLSFFSGPVYSSFYAKACAILHAFCWSRQHQQVCHFSSLLLLSDSRSVLATLSSPRTSLSSPKPRQRYRRRLAFLSHLNQTLNLCTLLRLSITGSSSTSPNFPNCSSLRKPASIFADYLKCRFAVSQPKAMRSTARDYLSELRRAVPINSRLNVVVQYPTPFGLGRNGCWPPRGSQLPRALPFIFSLCFPLNDHRRAAHRFFKIGRLFSLFLFSCPCLALLRLLILLLLLMSGNLHPNPGPIFPCSVCAGNVTWRGKSVLCCACSK